MPIGRETRERKLIYLYQPAHIICKGDKKVKDTWCKQGQCTLYLLPLIVPRLMFVGVTVKCDLFRIVPEKRRLTKEKKRGHSKVYMPKTFS